MIKWEIVYFPAEGEKHSPVGILKYLVPANDQANIIRRLTSISELETGDWPHWVKMVKHLYQLTAHDYRVYFGLINRKIVICHICRKEGQKANPGDLDRARKNLSDYIESIK